LSLAALKASLALWQRRVTARTKLYVKARQELDEARAKDTHPRQALVDRLEMRAKQLGEAQKNVERRQKQIAAKQKGNVRRPHEVIKRSVVCQSSRNGVKPSLIVLHDTEGGNVPNSTKDLQGLGDYFDRLSTQASSNVAVDSDGYSAQYVPDKAKAWAQAAYNPQALSIEQIGFMTQKSWPEAQLKKTAQYIAYWSKTYGIPITYSTSHGVCEHKNLGAKGGGHLDCGPTYPFDRVLSLARDYADNGW
jgi:hypothetical protein